MHKLDSKMAKKQTAIALTPTQVVIPKRQSTKADNFLSTYVNQAQVNVSPWDIKITLGVVESSDAQGINVIDVAEIRMSPLLARQLAGILSKQVDIFEKSFGKIPSPEFVG